MKTKQIILHLTVTVMCAVMVYLMTWLINSKWIVIEFSKESSDKAVMIGVLVSLVLNVIILTSNNNK